jgi:FHA domain-containing protein
VRARQPGRPRPGEPAAAASLFAPAHEQAAGSVVGLAPGSTPPAGFAPSPDRAPETRPPPPAQPSTATAPGLLFQPPDGAAERPDQRRGPRIRGYRCENGHLNDPRSPSCRECAAPIDERVGGLVAGPRPALGTLVFEDGAAHVVDGGYLIGGRPDADDRVRTGELRPIVVDDGSVAPAHAEIRVSGWDVMVVDAGSHNRTYVSGPDEGRWTPLPPRRSRRLLPGTRVRLGDGRTFVFESSSTVR